MTTTHSTIYSRCPSCRKDGLVQQVQASYRCALCNYDYLDLARDPAAREAWMLENLQLGGFFVLYVMFLHRMIMALPVAESNALVLAFAQQHGIKLPKGISPFLIVGIAVAVAVLVPFAIALVMWLLGVH